MSPDRAPSLPALDIGELVVFFAVVDEGSVLGAARRLGQPRSTVRRRLDELEARLGLAVLFRTAEGATLTEAGKVLATEGRRLLHDAEALAASLRGLGDEPQGTLRVVCPEGLPLDVVVFALQGAALRFPNVTVDLSYRATPPASPDEADVFLQFGDALPTGPWVTSVVHRMRCWLVASEGWLARHGPIDTLDALRAHRVLCWRGPERPAHELPLREGGRVAVRAGLVSGDVHLLRQLARAGGGVAFVPDALLPEPDGPDGALVPVLPELLGATCALRVLVPERILRVAKIRAVLDEIRAVVERIDAR